MRNTRLLAAGALFGLLGSALVQAQQLQATTTVPRLVRFSGSFRPAAGATTPSVESVTLSVYGEQSGGTPLWQEVQNVSVDSEGRYSLLMGATLNEGMPIDLFKSGEPRWLGTQMNRAGEAEQARVLLVSVPYALKASDAETLGGRPASDYLLATPVTTTSTSPAVSTSTPAASNVTANTVSTAVKPRVNSGSPNFVGKFTNATDLISSSLYEINGNVGISNANPLIALDVRTGSLPQMGIAGTTDYLTFFASDQFGPAIYWDPAKDMRFGKGGTSLYNPFGFVEYMRIQSSTGNMGIGTITPASKLDVGGDINMSGPLRFLGTAIVQPVKGSNNLFSDNFAVGFGVLQNNTTGLTNTGVGNGALQANTTGTNNTGSGNSSLGANTTGTANTASGAQALLSNTTGNDNTALGVVALNFNTIGGDNTGLGALALFNNTVGNRNLAVGSQALANNTIGNNNTALGYGTLTTNISGSNNLAIGINAGSLVASSNSNNVHIANLGGVADAATIRIGTPGTQTAFFAAGVRGVTTANNDAVAVMVDSNGQLGTVSSSRRFKEDIQDMGSASLDLMRLRPVVYRYKQPFADGSKPVQFGLIAEEVAEVYPEMVAHSADGQIETVKYQLLDTMLLNEVQRQQTTIRQLEQKIADQNQRQESLLDRLNKLEATVSGPAQPPVH